MSLKEREPMAKTLKLTMEFDPYEEEIYIQATLRATNLLWVIKNFKKFLEEKYMTKEQDSLKIKEAQKKLNELISEHGCNFICK